MLIIRARKLPDIIQSKTGRFIKPGATWNNLGVGDEIEVLFKPGVRFKIVKRVDANEVRADNGSTTYNWPTNMDGELANVLNQDVEKAKVKIVVKKEEV